MPTPRVDLKGGSESEWLLMIMLGRLIIMVECLIDAPSRNGYSHGYHNPCAESMEQVHQWLTIKAPWFGCGVSMVDRDGASLMADPYS